MHQQVHILVSLFAIMNPLLSLSYYFNLTKNFNKQQKKTIITVCCFTIFILLTASLLFGKDFFDFLDIHSYTLRIGGGVLILIMGIEIVLKKNEDNKSKENFPITYDKNRILSLGVSPLAIPLIAGPGSIVMMILQSNSSTTIYSKLSIILMILILCLIIFLMFLLADFIRKFLGDLGILVLTKMLGLFLTALAFEMIIDGLKDALPIILENIK